MEDSLVNLIAGGVARHMLTGLGGVLVTDGAIGSGDKASFIRIGSGIAVWLVGLAWSAWQKQGHAAVVKQLKQLRGPHA